MMAKFKDKFIRFMYGRYAMFGMDTFNKVLFWVYAGWIAVFLIADIFVPWVWFTIAYWAVSMLLSYWIFFRMFSKNIAARRRENERLCGFFKLLKNKFKDRKTHVYRKCPKCKAVLRLPKSKGKHYVVCPRCKERFQVRG